MNRTVLYTVNAAEVEAGDYVDISGIVQGEVARVDDEGFQVTLWIRDEDEHGDLKDWTVDPFDEVEILGF